MFTHDSSLRRAVRLFGFLAAILGQPFLARAVLANTDQNYVQSQRQQAADAASLPEIYPYGTMAATSISPFVGTTTDSAINPNFPSASASVAQFPGAGNPNAVAKAFADLASGTLGAYAQSYGPQPTSAASEAGFWDTLTFSGVSGPSTGTINLTISGNFVTTGQGSACLLTGGGLCNPLFLTPFSNWPTLDSAHPSEVLTASFPLINGSPVEISAGIFSLANNPTSTTVLYPTADLYDPPTLSLVLPAGVTYTSASNMFLTSPVPEPASAWLFGSGLLGLIGVARRKKTPA